MTMPGDRLCTVTLEMFSILSSACRQTAPVKLASRQERKLQG